VATIYTIGHSNHSVEALLSLLRQAGAELVADVRSVPKSRFNPQFNSLALAELLRGAGIGYRHMPALGGLRGPRKDGLPSPNEFWKEENFRNFADYTATAEFREGLKELREAGRAGVCVILCAEADWRQCHRQILTDRLLAAGETVIHIGKDGSQEIAVLAAAAVIGTDGTITYPPAQGSFLL
jgi:uncharacterized protein (DUF488 family)